MLQTQILIKHRTVPPEYLYMKRTCQRRARVG